MNSLIYFEPFLAYYCCISIADNKELGVKNKFLVNFVLPIKNTVGILIGVT